MPDGQLSRLVQHSVPDPVRRIPCVPVKWTPFPETPVICAMFPVPTVPTPWKLFPVLLSKSMDISGTTLLVVRRYRTSSLVNVVEMVTETSL